MSRHIIAFFALTGLLVAPSIGSAQMRHHGHGMGQQDTSRAGGPMMMGRMHGMGMMPGSGAMGMMMMGGPGPAMLIDLEKELDLTAEQLGRLEELRDRAHEAMQTHLEALEAAFESARAADAERDWAALEGAIDAAMEARAAMARTHLSVHRDAQGVLTDAQRDQLASWERGHRIFRRHMMEGRWPMHRGTHRWHRGSGGGR